MDDDFIAPEMRLFSPKGNRLYLTANERARFLGAAHQEKPINRIFCHVLHYTGCRSSEALELDFSRIAVNNSEITFRTLKKRKYDQQDRIKQQQYRAVPVPKERIEHLDLVFGVRGIQ